MNDPQEPSRPHTPHEPQEPIRSEAPSVQPETLRLAVLIESPAPSDPDARSEHLEERLSMEEALPLAPVETAAPANGQIVGRQEVGEQEVGEQEANDREANQREANDRENDREVERAIHRLSRRSFLWAGVTLATGIAGWKWLIRRPEQDGILWPLRRALQFDERITRSYFNPARLAPTFPASMAREPRPNGPMGLASALDPQTWRLSLEGAYGADGSRTLSLEEIRALPRVEMVTEHKCIEGWSVIVHWTGARFADFAAKYPPPTRTGALPDVHLQPEDLVRYVGMTTPDENYYIGLDMESALHPQTLLCYEMNGQPLTEEHGAPLRLIIPVKYGIKSIKRLGTIRYTDTQPADYWAERGYDWYAGH